MKRKISLLIFALLLCGLCGCMGFDRHIPSGYTQIAKYFENSIQDSTDYARYTYPVGSETKFTGERGYTEVTQENITAVTGYFENFAEWALQAQHLEGNYDFKLSQITEGDRWYVSTKEGQPVGDGKYGVYDDYTLYYYDTESGILYYLHTNI